MSNADNVRAFYELGQRQDYRDAVAAGDLASFFAQPEFAPFLDAFDAELEITEPRDLPDQQVFAGKDAFIVAMQAWPTHFDDFRAELEMNVFNAQWFRDGRLYRWEMYLDRDEALRAVGLEG